jgi:ribosome-binding factor A
MKKNTNRQNRVATEIKRVLSEFLLRNSIDDAESNCDSSLISITDIIVSSCLQHAKVFAVSLSNDFDNDECVAFLDKHKSKLRGHIGATIRMKYTPDLQFFVDDSFEKGARIDELLKKISAH